MTKFPRLYRSRSGSHRSCWASSPGGRSTRARTFNESWRMRGFGTLPNIRYRMRRRRYLFLFLENLFAAPHQLFRLRRSLPAEKLQRLGFQLVGGHEEFFQLFLDFGRQVINAMQLPLAVRIFGNGDDAIIADAVAFGFLHRLKDA